MKRALIRLLVIAAAAGAWVARSRLEGEAAPQGSERELLYLPDPKYLRVASLGQAPLVADVLYLWAIQFYSDYERRDRYLFVERIFSEVIPELDPHYVDPYWLGALILTVEVGDTERGLRLLDQGFEANPDAWILPYLAGWEARRAGQLRRAARYFELASAVEGAPVFVRRLGAGMYARAGDLHEAVRGWEEVLHDPRSDDVARAIAERWLRDLRIRINLAQAQTAVAAFRDRFGRHPRNLDEMVSAGVMRAVPGDADGRPFTYDPATGTVSAPIGRILGAR